MSLSPIVKIVCGSTLFAVVVIVESLGACTPLLAEPDTLAQLVRADSLDPLPEWPEYDNSLLLAVWNLSLDPRRESPFNERLAEGLFHGETYLAEQANEIVTYAFQKFTAIRLLAWQTVVLSDCPVPSEINRNNHSWDKALLWCEYWSPYDKSDQWALVMLQRYHAPDSGWQWTLVDMPTWHMADMLYGRRKSYDRIDSLMSPAITPLELIQLSHEERGWYPIQMFHSPPTNDDIYSFIDRARSIPWFMYWSFDSNEPVAILSEGEVKVCSQFIDCDVRENTWEAVVGEKPERFFPGGR